MTETVIDIVGIIRLRRIEQRWRLEVEGGGGRRKISGIITKDVQ